MNSWQSTAPSNIALIKYMGKEDAKINQASNPSISYTLNHLYSTVELTLIEDSRDQFCAFTDSAHPIALSPAQQQRFLAHLAMLKNHFACHQNFLVRSANSFPADCGLASSASSYAALTKCAIKAICDLQQRPLPTTEQQAKLSQLGSGSSCRSFFSPWALWHGDEIKQLNLPQNDLLHQVIIVDRAPKSVSSSMAHQRIQTSLLFNNRASRVAKRLEALINALAQNHWHQAYELCWQEFWDMHALFATSAPPFSYLKPESLMVLDKLTKIWQQQDDGPIVTMDAGANIHCLYRPAQIKLAKAIETEFNQQFLIIGNNPNESQNTTSD